MSNELWLAYGITAFIFLVIGQVFCGWFQADRKLWALVAVIWLPALAIICLALVAQVAFEIGDNARERRLLRAMSAAAKAEHEAQERTDG